MRNAEKIALHRAVFEKKSDYQPLIIDLKRMTPLPAPIDALRCPERALEDAVSTYERVRNVGSDGIPFVESNFLEVLVPTLFGAKTHVAPGGLIDVKPIFNDLQEALGGGDVDLYGGEMENALRHIEFLKNNAPDWLYVNPSRFMAPLDYAVVLRGGDFYFELYEEPEMAAAFMEKIADVTIRAIRLVKEAAGQPLNEFMTPRGYLYPGIRLTGDAVVNLSPAMIEKIMCPLYQRFEQEFGRVMLHYCCTPAPSTHVLGALMQGGGVDCVDNWQGYQTLVPAELETQSAIGICTDIPEDWILDGTAMHNAFFDVRGRVLASSTVCADAAKGNELWKAWHDMQKKRVGDV